MDRLDISLPDPLRDFVEEQVRARGYTSASEYVGELVRADQIVKAKERLEQELVSALDDGPEHADPAYWEAVKREALDRTAHRKAGS
jgi:antitoxin ParD1/3/4